MLACGILLIGMMTALLVGFSYILAFNGKPGVRFGFTGGPVMAVFVYGLFSALLVFGFGAARAGIYQVRYSQRSPDGLRWASFLVPVLGFAGVAVQILDLILD